jgi:phage-related minor tail protein
VETVLTLAEVVALVCVSALCVYLIVVLTNLKRDFSEISQRSKPVLDNLAYITDKLKSAAGKIDDQVDIVKGSLNSLRSVAENVLLFEERVQRQLEEPIFQVASVIGAIVTSIAAFIDRFRTRQE